MSKISKMTTNFSTIFNFIIEKFDIASEISSTNSLKYVWHIRLNKNNNFSKRIHDFQKVIFI